MKTCYHSASSFPSLLRVKERLGLSFYVSCLFSFFLWGVRRGRGGGAWRGGPPQKLGLPSQILLKGIQIVKYGGNIVKNQ